MKKKLLIKCSENIAEQLIEKSYESSTEVSWINIDISPSKQWVMSPFDNSLYSGLIGSAMLYLYLFKYTANSDYLQILSKILNTINNNMKVYKTQDFSVFLGKGGWLYLNYCLWVELKEDKYQKNYTQLVEEILHTDLSKCKIDYVSGLSSLLVLLCNIYIKKSSNQVYQLIEKIANNISEKAIKKENYVFWKSDIDETEILNGFSHGLSGIAFALAKASVVTGNLMYKNYALKALLFENTRFKENNWIDLRNRENRKEKGIPDPLYWCHGAPGIGLSRALLINCQVNEKFIYNDLDNALTITKKKGSLSSDCLCHGKFGNLELFLQTAEALDDASFYKLAIEYAFNRVKKNEIWVSGIPQDKDSYSFMLGLTGIAYQLLRIAEPKKIPSILSLEVDA